MNQNIQDYIDSVQDERKELFMKFQAIILKYFPEVNTKISFSMPFYTTSTGWIFLRYWQKGVALYMGIIPTLLAFKKKFPKIKTGKGSIKFDLKDDVPWEDMEEVIREALTTRTSSMRS